MKTEVDSTAHRKSRYGQREAKAPPMFWQVSRTSLLFRVLLFRVQLFRVLLFRVQLFRVLLFRFLLFRVQLFLVGYVIRSIIRGW